MGTYDDLHVGQRIVSPSAAITADDAAVLVRTLGYTHPLFRDAEYVRERTAFPATPLPGEVTLAFMGGLAEQTDVFDDTVVALVSIDRVRFLNAAFAGESLRLEMEVVDKQPSGSGRRGVMTFAWRCSKDDGMTVAEATARLLFSRTGA